MATNGKDTEPYILFELGKTSYGIHSRFVQQLEMIEEITPVPNAPAFVEGVVLSRGKVIPAINLRVRFGFERIKHDSRSRLVVVNLKDRTIGLVVDTAREFVPIPSDTIQPPPEKMSGLSGKYLENIAMLDERLVLLLDMQEILEASENLNLSTEVLTQEISQAE
jgi:purine-binding chemotaxis protein CheW